MNCKLFTIFVNLLNLISTLVVRIVGKVAVLINSFCEYYAKPITSIEYLDDSGLVKDLQITGFISADIENGKLLNTNKVKVLKNLAKVAVLFATILYDTAAFFMEKNDLQYIGHVSLALGNQFRLMQVIIIVAYMSVTLQIIHFQLNCGNERRMLWITIFDKNSSLEVIQYFTLSKSQYLKWWVTLRRLRLLANVEVNIGIIATAMISVVAASNHNSNTTLVMASLVMRIIGARLGIRVAAQIPVIYLAFTSLMNTSLANIHEDVERIRNDFQQRKHRRWLPISLLGCLQRLIRVARFVHHFDLFFRHQIGLAFFFYFFLPISCAFVALGKDNLDIASVAVCAAGIVFLANILVFTLCGSVICQKFLDTTKFLFPLISERCGLKTKFNIRNMIAYFGDNRFEGLSVSGCFVFRYELAAVIYFEIANFLILLIQLQSL